MKICIIGGGIVGLAIARELSLRSNKVTVLEKEDRCGSHQTKRNSGVMHAGLYYKPGSLKDKLSREGINKMKSYCDSKNIKWREVGKIVVATRASQLGQLSELYERGKKNDLRGIKMINRQEASKKEPYVNCVEAIQVPEESIVDYTDVAKSYINDIKENDGEIHTNWKVNRIERTEKKIIVEADNGKKIESEILVICTGLYSDRVAKMAEINIGNRKIVPFRGEYYKLKKEYSNLVNGLIYPVPNPNFPFLGVHFTKMINDEVEAGPNAVPALSREGYTWKDYDLRDIAEMVTFEGLIRFAAKYPKEAFEEVARSLIKSRFVESLKELIPNIEENMVEAAPAGVRAQLLNSNGTLEQDFSILRKENIVSVLNAPSPAATSSLAIARYVVEYLGLD